MRYVDAILEQKVQDFADKVCADLGIEPIKIIVSTKKLAGAVIRTGKREAKFSAYTPPEYLWGDILHEITHQYSRDKKLGWGHSKQFYSFVEALCRKYGVKYHKYRYDTEESLKRQEEIKKRRFEYPYLLICPIHEIVGMSYRTSPARHYLAPPLKWVCPICKGDVSLQKIHLPTHIQHCEMVNRIRKHLKELGDERYQ